MNYAAFDIEIAKDLPENGRWQDVAPLGITCAAIAFSDGRKPQFYTGIPSMSRLDCQKLVRELEDLSGQYRLLTWNGCGFDFAVLAQESGLIEECARLALDHIDLMLTVTFTKGWYLSLEKALKGYGLKGKRKVVTLKDGTVLEDMHGEKAPRLWAAGEHEAVLTYLADDVGELIKLMNAVDKTGWIRWTSNSGKLQTVSIPKSCTVQRCFDIPKPDTSWMSDPPTREQFVKWMPEDI